MLAAIAAAEKSVGLMSYIFRADKAGEAFHQALIQAQRRGVQVRVLIDGVGGGYFWSGTYNHLRRAGVPVARFLHSYFPLAHAVREPAQPPQGAGDRRAPGLHRRHQHRRREHRCADNPPHIVLDTHFQLEGPIVEQLTDAFADDWLFTTGEKLLTDHWFPPLEKAGDRDGPRRHVRSRRGHGADRVRGAARHLLRPQVGARGDALLPAARSADLVAGPRRAARRQGRHRAARAFQPCRPRLGAPHTAQAADRGAAAASG